MRTTARAVRDGSACRCPAGSTRNGHVTPAFELFGAVTAWLGLNDSSQDYAACGLAYYVR